MTRLLRIAAFGAVAVALLAWPVAWVLGTQAETYQLFAPRDAATVQVNKLTTESPGDPGEVTSIYGTPIGKPTTFLFVDESEVTRPPEAPGLALLRQPKHGEYLQLKTVHHLARLTTIGAAVAAVLLLGLLWFLRRRRAYRPTGGKAKSATGEFSGAGAAGADDASGASGDSAGAAGAGDV